jgi:tRNA 2-thiouridine synthesizing protein A
MEVRDTSQVRRVEQRSQVTESPTEVLDCTGLQCPLPVVKTAQAIKKLPAGEVLELLATDPGVEPDMNAWTRRTGNELLGITKEGDVFHVLIRKAK